LRKVKNGDSFEELYYEIRNNFHHLGSSFLRGLSPENQEEVFQNVCIGLIENIPNHQPELGCSSWIKAIIRNKTTDFFRRLSKTPEGVEFDENEFSVESGSIETRNELLNVMDGLAVEETNLLLEIKLFGRTFKEMAFRTGKSSIALKVSLHRTLKKIRQDKED
jgi:RNA polymerase sigma-70 factor (ECF subfamily)